MFVDVVVMSLVVWSVFAVVVVDVVVGALVVVVVAVVVVVGRCVLVVVLVTLSPSSDGVLGGRFQGLYIYIYKKRISSLR